jgi:hypothetical protein
VQLQVHFHDDTCIHHSGALASCAHLVLFIVSTSLKAYTTFMAS